MAYLRRFTGLALGLISLCLVITGSVAVDAISADVGISVESSGQRAASEGLPQSKIVKKSAKTTDQYYAAQLDKLGIILHPGTEHREDSKPTAATSRKCKSLVYQTLMKLPAEQRNQLSDLTLFYTEDGRRGLGGSGSIVLRCLNVTDAELVSVFTHEMGHIVDGSYLEGSADGSASGFFDFDEPVKIDDPSSEFYKISWDSESKVKDDAVDLDFVSLYAMSDPFEDFAETYAYFRLHGPEFRKLLNSSSMLQEKYEFMKNDVFGGEEFGGIKKNLNIWERDYDVTVLPFSLRTFLTNGLKTAQTT
ncbi:hypothetical protein HZA42_00440 [Candidatus Peregrinibacteria bacterium]|nr:hypothetical protein [Candidatus Peregrinibacteria bacterium]